MIFSPFQSLTSNLVGQLTDGETIFAIKAKGSDDLIKALVQAKWSL